MSNPTVSQVHINQPLSNVLVGYFQEQPSALRAVFPPVSVKKRSDSYFIWNKGDLMRSDAAVRAPGNAPVDFNIGISNTSYTCVEYALRYGLVDELESNADFNVREPIAKALGQKLMLRETLLFASTYLVGSVWATDNTLAGATQWSDINSTPVAAVRLAKRTIKLSTGFMPNVMTMNDAVADALIEHPDLRGRLAVTQMQNIGYDQRASFLGQIFGLEVIILDQIYNSAVENQTASMGAAVTDNCLIAYRSTSPAINAPSAGYTFEWSSESGGSSVKTYRDGDEGKRMDWLEASTYVAPQVVATDCGYLFIDVLA